MPPPLENYASPALRWSLLLEDDPGATHEFKLQVGTETGIPQQFGGSGNFCVCTIHFPTGSKKAPVHAYKTVPAKGTSDEWNVLCSKTLGRALKKAGYPDNLVDLKALVRWRQGQAELASALRGTPLALAPPQGVMKALEAAATPEGDDHPPVAIEAPPIMREPAEFAEVIEVGEPVDAVRLTAVRGELNNLVQEDMEAFRGFLAEMTIPAKAADWSQADLDAIELWLHGEEA